MQDSLTFDLSVLPDQPKAPALDVSLLPDKPDPPFQATPERAQLLDRGGPEAGADPAAYLQHQQWGERSADKVSDPEKDQLLPVGNTPSDAVIRAPHDDGDLYNKLLENATSDEEVMAAVFTQPLVDALKRLYSPDTTSPKALAAAQNAIAIYQTTGISPVLTLENPDAVNQALFGTGHAREEFLMNTIEMFGLGAFAEAANPLAAAAGLTRYVRAADAAGEALKLREVGGSLLPETESIYKGWSLPLGIAGYTAEENANALVRSYIEGKPFAETKPYGLHDILPPQESEGAKAAADLLDMLGKFKAMHAGFEGLQSLWDALAYDKVSQVVPSEKLYIPAEAIRNHFGASDEGSAGEYYDIIQNLQKEGILSNSQIKDAVNYGLDVEVPLSRLVGSMDAPWLAKIKDYFRISPYKEVYEVPAGKPDARLHVSGELAAPAVLPEAGAGSPEKIGAQSTVETSVPERELTPPESEGPPVAAFESEAHAQPAPAETGTGEDWLWDNPLIESLFGKKSLKSVRGYVEKPLPESAYQADYSQMIDPFAEVPTPNVFQSAARLGVGTVRFPGDVFKSIASPARDGDQVDYGQMRDPLAQVPVAPFVKDTAKGMAEFTGKPAGLYGWDEFVKAWAERPVESVAGIMPLIGAFFKTKGLAEPTPADASRFVQRIYDHPEEKIAKEFAEDINQKAQAVPQLSAEESEGFEGPPGSGAGDVQELEKADGGSKVSGSPYRQLEKALEAAGEPRPAGHAGHHTVSVFDIRAELARQILQEFDIPLNSADNGVWLPLTRETGPGAYHPGLNTTKYHAEVYERLREATNRERGIQILLDIKKELSENRFPF